MAATHRAGQIDVYGTDDMRALIEATRQDAMASADYFANLGAALEKRITLQLRKEGLAHRGLLGSDERRAARSVTRHLLTIADYQVWTAQAIIAAGQAWSRNIAEPIYQARSSAQDADVLKI